MVFLKGLRSLLLGVGELQKRAEEKQAAEDAEMEANGYVKQYYPNGSVQVKKGTPSVSAPRLFDKDGTEIRPFTPNDFNNERQKR